jgi:hypothetical protein
MFEKGTLMHKPTDAFVAVAILSVASLSWKAEAATGLNKAFISAAVENKMPIQEVACWPRKIDICPWHKKLRHGRCIPCTY